MMGSTLLVLGTALAGALSSGGSGTVVSDAELLTRVTGAADCVRYGSSKCIGTGCTTSDCNASGSINPYAPKGESSSVDCSSNGCGSCYVYSGCAS